MTILIKGMEMPEFGALNIFVLPDGKVLGEVSGQAPLRLNILGTAVPVPTPHGRLGDLDRLYKHIKAECNIYGKPTIGFEDGNKVLKIIADTRTVIEGEQE